MYQISLREREVVYQQTVQKLLDKLNMLDHDSLLHLLSGLGQQHSIKTIAPVQLKESVLTQIETIVIRNFHKFVSSDISIPIMTLFQNGSNPVLVL